MSRPWMPLYCAEYIGHTTHLSAAESGAYLHLIMHYWVHGSLPVEDAPLSRIAKMTAQEWRKAKPAIASFFRDGWKHDRVEHELRSASDAYERRSGAGRKGGNAKAKGKQKPSNATAENEALQKQSQSQLESRSSLRSDLDEKNIQKSFGDFWAAHPRPADRGVTEELFEEIANAEEATAADLVAGAKRYAAECAKAGTEPQWIKKSSNWLRDRCWQDGQPKPDVVLPVIDEDSDEGRAWDEYTRRTKGRPMMFHNGRATVRTPWPPQEGHAA